ncbi:MAG: hypothetical protein ACOYK1_07570 [Vampirovibrionia bacterium]|jgi:hypothetical protein
MKDIPESLKYKADILKYAGLAMFSVPSTIIFRLATDYNYEFTELDLKQFLISLLLGILGIRFVMRGFEILSEYDEKKVNSND